MRRIHRAASRLGITALLTLLCACSNSPIPDPAATTVAGATFAPAVTAAPMIASEAFLGEEAFFVAWEQQGERTWATGNWAARIDLSEIDAEAGRIGPTLLPLGARRATPWTDLPGNLLTGPILPIEAWQTFRKRLFDAAALPGTPGRSGVVLHFFNDDYFLYTDGAGAFHAVPLTEKPGVYTIADNVAFERLMARGLPLMESLLAERGISARRVLLNTGDTGPWSLPFLYVNLDLPAVVFLRNEPVRAVHGSTVKAAPYAQLSGHLVASHVGDFLLRPVSAVYRLLFSTADTLANPLISGAAPPVPDRTPPPVTDGPGMDLAGWESRLTTLTGREPVTGTIEYLVDGEAFFTRLIDSLSRAESSIKLRTYIFDNDDFAEKIATLLKQRSRAGVDVAVLLDGVGSILSTMERQDTLPDFWEGRHSIRAFLEQDSEVNVRTASNPWFTGDHVKTVVVDDRVAWTGGMNIAREYRYDWHDMMVEVRGPVVGILADEFRRAWSHAGLLGDLGYLGARLAPPHTVDEVPGSVPMRVLFTRPDDPEIFRTQRAAARAARGYIYVQNAYFTDDALLKDLIEARHRGVDVRVIMPLVTDRGAVTRNNALAANAMLANGIRVFVYPGMSHVKAAVFDGWASLGSANWDRWSLKINKELNVSTSDPDAVAGLLDALFEPDFARSPELTEPFPERWSDFLLEFVGDYVF